MCLLNIDFLSVKTYQIKIERDNIEWPVVCVAI